MKLLTAGVSTQDLVFRRSGSLAGTPRVPFTLGGAVIGVVVNHLTAHMTMHRIANIRSSERILVHGAAGGVRTAVLELGKLAGLQMYGTASRYSHELVCALAAKPIDYHTDGFAACPWPYRRWDGCRVRPQMVKPIRVWYNLQHRFGRRSGEQGE